MGNGHVHALNTPTKNRANWMRASYLFSRLKKNGHYFCRRVYVYKKHCNSSFGDLVPYIIANSLQINIIIISKSDRYSLHGITCSDSYPVSNIFVYNQDMHYDAILYKRYTIPSTCDDSGETVAVIHINTNFLRQSRGIFWHECGFS